jgi:polyisoprenoid-binding protein YceI
LKFTCLEYEQNKHDFCHISESTESKIFKPKNKTTMKTRKLLLFVAFVLMTGVAFGQKAEWKFDKSHSKIQFTATHMKISEVPGQFKDYSGTIMAGEDFTDAEIEVTIQVNSIDTDNDKRDGHLKAEDFFNASKYPEIKFKSESLEKVEGNKYKLKGKLTIKDVTKTEEFDVKYMGTVEAMGATRAGFKVTGSIDRFDYNVDWDKSFGQGLIVGREIGITANVELIKE